jgi:hypothetical protein
MLKSGLGALVLVVMMVHEVAAAEKPGAFHRVSWPWFVSTWPNTRRAQLKLGRDAVAPPMQKSKARDGALRPSQCRRPASSNNIRNYWSAGCGCILVAGSLG